MNKGTGTHDVDRFFQDARAGERLHGGGWRHPEGVFSNEVIKKLADRHFGIGFDQLLLVEPPYDPELDFHYRIFNADGSEVEQCGNGARCFARFVRLKGLINRDRIAVSTARGASCCSWKGRTRSRSTWGCPSSSRARSVPGPEGGKTYLLRAQEHTVMCGAVSMGNPHCVIEVPSVVDAPVATLGPIMERHERFPERVNVGFMEMVNASGSSCGCSNAGWARPWPAVPAPAPPWWWASARASSRSGSPSPCRGQADHRLEGAGSTGLHDRAGRARI